MKAKKREQPQLAPVNRSLSQLSMEIWNAAENLAAIEGAIGVSVDSASRVEASVLRELQAIDLLHQTLLALADYTMNLSTAVPADLEINVAETTSNIKLHDLATRLKGASSADDSEPAPTLEHVVLFD